MPQTPKSTTKKSTTISTDTVPGNETIADAGKEPESVVKENATADSGNDTAPAKLQKSKKKFEPSEYIVCRSCTPGGYNFLGMKSKRLYYWNYEGDETEVEYQDLYSASGQNNNTSIYSPRFIILDDDFLDLRPAIRKVYDSMYSYGDLKNILKLQPAMLKEALQKLPPGALDSIKILAVEMVENGSLDSIRKIRVLDNFFGTELLTLVE